jgi:hypothetical protein
LTNVTVSPETFTMVDYDAGAITALVERLADRIGLGDRSIEVRIDETMPLGRVRIASTDPVVLEIDGGALEDPKRLRQFYELGATRTIGRLLFEVQDLLRPDFGTPPDREDLELAERVAWDAYASGRVARLGYDAQQQRWRYAFRTRHGFSDGVDRAFDLLWSGDELTWADIEQLSADAVASANSATPTGTSAESR